MNYSFKQLALVAFMGIGLAGCFNSHDHEVAVKNKSATGIDDGLPADAPTYLAVTSALYEPYTYRGEQGQAIGFEIDVFNAIAKNQGFRVDYLIQPWPKVFSTVKEGSRDIAVSGLAYRKKRAKDYNLPPPHMDAPDGIAWLKDKVNITDFNDLLKFKVAVLRGGQYEEQVKALGVPDENIVSVETTFLAFKSLMNGEVDAVVDDGLVLQYCIEQYKDEGYEFAYRSYALGEVANIAFLVNKDNNELYDKVIAGLKNIKIDGTLQKIKNKWFGKQG